MAGGELLGWRTRAKIEALAKARNLDADLGDDALTEAYKAVFERPNDPHVQMVLADLAGFSGFYQVAPPNDFTAGSLDRREGRREVFARIFSRLLLSERDLSDLEAASMDEADALRRELGALDPGEFD